MCSDSHHNIVETDFGCKNFKKILDGPIGFKDHSLEIAKNIMHDWIFDVCEDLRYPKSAVVFKLIPWSDPCPGLLVGLSR